MLMIQRGDTLEGTILLNEILVTLMNPESVISLHIKPVCNIALSRRLTSNVAVIALNYRRAGRKELGKKGSSISYEFPL